MRIHLITVPYHMGRRDSEVGQGPGRYMEGGMGSVVQSGGRHQVTHVPIDAEFSTTPEKVNQLLTGAVAAAVAVQAFPLIIAGNCNSCLGILPAIAQPGLGIVWFDAHGDFHTRETSISGNLDGMALGLATAQFVDESKTMLLGVRDLDPGEKERIAASRMRVVPARDWQDGFVSKNLLAMERVYLHLDMDVIDAAVNPGVNFRGPGGLPFDRVDEALRTITRRYPLAAMALTNFQANRDVDHKTRDLGLRVMRTVCNSLG